MFRFLPKYFASTAIVACVRAQTGKCFGNNASTALVSPLFQQALKLEAEYIIEYIVCVSSVIETNSSSSILTKQVLVLTTQ